MIEAKIIKDSINPYDVRLTTWILKYPRWIHGEIMTHRHFSRNAASSRAIPFPKMVTSITELPAFPEKWGSHNPGMQSGNEIKDIELAKKLWLEARDSSISYAQKLNDLGLHKSLTNRLLEPWQHMTVLVTATDFENFFALRAHEAAQPEFQLLAYKMLDLYNNSTPDKVDTAEWHIPFSDKMPEEITLEQKLKIAVARCARLSYMTFDGEMNPEKDYELYDKLASSGHYSAFEHCAKVIDPNNENDTSMDTLSNFRFTWIQYRKMLDNECRKDSRVKEKYFE